LRPSKLPPAPSCELGLQNCQSTFKSQITDVIAAFAKGILGTYGHYHMKDLVTGSRQKSF